MLTDEAIYERKWGRFPTLGRLLGRLKIPTGHFGVLSTADTLPDHMGRCVEIAMISRAHAGEVRKAAATADAANLRSLHEDLERAARELDWAKAFFAEHAASIRDLREEIHAAAQEQRRRAPDVNPPG